MTDLPAIYNIDAEQAVLGIIFSHNEKLHRIPWLSPDHFYEPIHQRIFEEISRLINSGLGADPIVMKTWGNEQEALSALGGANYFMKISGMASGLLNVKSYAEIVFENARRRDFVDHIEDVRAMVDKTNDFDVNNAMNDLQDAMASFSCSLSQGEITTGTKISKKIVEDLDQNTNIEVYKTGLASLDQSLNGGLEPGTIVAVGGRPGHCKTMLGCTVSFNLAEQGHQHLYIAAEMGSERIYQRIMARRMGVNAINFKVKRKDKKFFNQAFGLLKTKDDNTLFKNAPGITLKEMERTIHSACRRYDIKCVIVDYVQLIRGMERGQSRVEHEENVMQTLEVLTKQHGFAALCLAQMNKDGGFRGGDPILNAADYAYQSHKVQLDKKYEGVWFENLKNREAMERDLGNKNDPPFRVSKIGPHLEQIQEEEIPL